MLVVFNELCLQEIIYCPVTGEMLFSMKVPLTHKFLLNTINKN